MQTPVPSRTGSTAAGKLGLCSTIRTRQQATNFRLCISAGRKQPHSAIFKPCQAKKTWEAIFIVQDSPQKINIIILRNSVLDGFQFRQRAEEYFAEDSPHMREQMQQLLSDWLAKDSGKALPTDSEVSGLCV